MYERIMERLQGKEIRIAVDATKDLLVNVLKYHPFLIKPNNHELGEIFGKVLESEADIVEYAKKLQEMGAVNVLISMAGDGAILVTEDGTVSSKKPPKGTVVNSVGAGDSMVAGFLAGWLNTGDYEKALELGGYKEDQILTGINGGTKVTTGFGHAAILSHAGTVVEAVKSGAIRHFFLVAGCDGAKPGRNYYTEFVLTLACGKFRFNDLELGEIGGLPRLMDMGQCNDAYGAIQVAVALADAFGCSVNELPLSFVLSWYEQKAVCILLTLLHLGIKNIRLGPSLPAFLSPNILNFLVENYGIAPITTPEEDIKALMNHSK